MTSKTLASVPPQHKLDFIQALRGIAALWVVLYHGSRFISPYGTGLGDLLFGPAGSMGVVLFFILSGFIMVHTTRNLQGGVWDAAQFLIKRFVRIWPVYAVVTLCYALVRLGGAGIFDNRVALGHIAHSLLFLPVGNGPPPQFGWPVLAVGWTLNYEMYFYALFGVSLLFGRWRWWALAAWLGVFLVLVPQLRGAVSLSPATDYGFAWSGLQLMTSPIVWQFIAGVVIGLLYHSHWTLWKPGFLKYLLFLTMSMAVWQYMSRARMGHGVLDWGTTLIPLVLAFCLASKRFTIPVWGPLVYLGDISFSLYLWHPLVQEMLSWPLVLTGHGDLTVGFAYLLLTTVVAITVAAISRPVLEVWLSDHVKRGLLALCAPWQRSINNRLLVEKDVT